LPAIAITRGIPFNLLHQPFISDAYETQIKDDRKFSLYFLSLYGREKIPAWGIKLKSGIIPILKVQLRYVIYCLASRV
jgi:hypothetical protein